MISNNYHQHPAYPHLLNSFQRTKTHLTIANLNIFCLFENPEILSAFLRKTTKKLQTTKKLKSLTFNFKGVQLARESIKVIDKDLFKGLYDLENLKIVLCPNTTYQNQYFGIIFKALKGFRCLKEFELIIQNQPDRVSLRSHMQNLIKILKKSAPRLQGVKFVFNEGIFAGLRGTNLPKLYKWGMKRLGSLQSLTLALPSIVLLDTVQIWS